MSENHDAELDAIRKELPPPPHSITDPSTLSPTGDFDEGASSELARVRLELAVCEAAQASLPEGCCLTALGLLERCVNALRPVKLKKYAYLITALDHIHSSDPIHRMSASNFFSQLYWDKGIKRALTPKDLHVLGSAVLFARWKEGIEYDVMEKGSGELWAWFGLSGGLSYSEPESEQKDFFTNYILKEAMKEQTGLDAFKEALLTISPWCPLDAIMDVLRDKAVIVSDPKLEYLLSHLPPVSEMLTLNKRVSEPQFWVGMMTKYFDNEEYAKQLKANGIMIDQMLINETEMFKLTEIASTMLDTPSFKKQVVAAEEELEVGISNGVVDQATEKALKQTLASEQLQLLIAMVLGTSAGLFLAAQKKVVQAVAGVLRQVLFKPWLHNI
jgi:hypothetical protein